MDRLISELKTSDNKLKMIECARAIVQFHKDTGSGNLQKALEYFNKTETKDNVYFYCRKNLSQS